MKFMENMIIGLSVICCLFSCLPDEDMEIDSGSGSGQSVADEYSVVYYPGENGVAYYRIPSICRTNKGTLLAFAEARVESKDDFSNIDVVVKRSEDNGETWSEMQVLKDYGPDKTGNQAPVVLPDGKVILLYTINKIPDRQDRHIFMRTSSDDGVTWTPEVEITDQILNPETQRSYATCPVHGLVKQYEPHKGRIIFAARVNSFKGWTTNHAAHVIYSDDNGETWHQGGYMDHPYGNECTVTELCNGDLLLNTRDINGADYHRYQAYSRDGGESFEPTMQSDLVEPATGCHGSILTYGPNPDAESESIVLFSNPSHTVNRKRGSIKVSYDSGQTWTKMYMYCTNSGPDQFTSYSDLVLLDDGVIGVFYESGRNCSTGLVFKKVRFSDIQDDYTYTVEQ